MRNALWALWAVLGLVALLWPSPIAGVVDGAPLDGRVEAIVAAAAVFAVWLRPALLRAALTRALIVALLTFHALISLTASTQGWCLQFVSPVPLYIDTLRVPHSWDVRADWRAREPRCSAVLRRDYDTLEEFPVWFYNLPPVDQGSPARAADRPPMVSLDLNATGFLTAAEAGVLRVEAGKDMTVEVDVSGRRFAHADAVAGIAVPAGVHRVRLGAHLERSGWALKLRWNDRPLWRHAAATVTEPTTLDRWLRPWASCVPVLALLVFVLLALARIAGDVRDRKTMAAVIAISLVAAALPITGSASIVRLGVIVLFVAVLLPVPAHLRNGFGASLLIGAPFLALFVVHGLPQIGVFTWYSSGDDWWMFQRYGYRIFMEGYWLEAGQKTFWFQPFYRYISGALHMVFGDSSVGELWWDAACAGVGAFFAFYVTRRFAGFRWGLAAAALTLAILVLGPAWYLFGRGLSELSSMGFIYAAAVTAFRARRGRPGAMLATAVLCALAFYTRLNNLPIVFALALCAWPTRQAVAGVWHPRDWRRASPYAFFTVLGGVALAMLLFTWRTYYYTGHFDMLYGTQARHLALWLPHESLGSNLMNIAGSLAMVITMTDPPAFDIRAVPIIAGIAVAMFGLLGVKPFRTLPVSAVALALAGVSGAIVARGTAYPGRFSLHLIPAAVTLFVCAIASLISGRRPRSTPRAPQSPGTT